VTAITKATNPMKEAADALNWQPVPLNSSSSTETHVGSAGLTPEDARPARRCTITPASEKPAHFRTRFPSQKPVIFRIDFCL
jgi:hypothetical protein